MNVTYSEKVKQLGIDDGLLQRATKTLEAIVSPSAESVSAEWDCLPDERGRMRYTLKLSGFAKDVSATFYPSDLSQDRNIRYQLLDLWSDLLQAYSNDQVKKLQQLVLQGTTSGETDAR